MRKRKIVHNPTAKVTLVILGIFGDFSLTAPLTSLLTCHRFLQRYLQSEICRSVGLNLELLVHIANSFL